MENIWENFRGTGGKLVGKPLRNGWKECGETSEGRVESLWENFRGTGGKHMRNFRGTSGKHMGNFRGTSGKLMGKLERDGWKACGETSERRVENLWGNFRETGVNLPTSLKGDAMRRSSV